MTNSTLFVSLQIMCGSFDVVTIARDSSTRHRIYGDQYRPKLMTCLSENPMYRQRNGHIPTEWRCQKSAMVLTGSESAVITEKTAGHVRAELL